MNTVFAGSRVLSGTVTSVKNPALSIQSAVEEDGVVPVDAVESDLFEPAGVVAVVVGDTSGEGTAVGGAADAGGGSVGVLVASAVGEAI